MSFANNLTREQCLIVTFSSMRFYCLIRVPVIVLS